MYNPFRIHVYIYIYVYKHTLTHTHTHTHIASNTKGEDLAPHQQLDGINYPRN